MPMMPNKEQLKEIVKLAMWDATPKAMRQAREEGTLDQILEDRAQAALETYQKMIAEPVEAMGLTLEKQIQESQQRRSQAIEIALSQATEFQAEESPNALIAA